MTGVKPAFIIAQKALDRCKLQTCTRQKMTHQLAGLIEKLFLKESILKF